VYTDKKKIRAIFNFKPICFAEFLRKFFPVCQFWRQCKSEYKSGNSFGLSVSIFAINAQTVNPIGTVQD
jgi:hypothetical protein